MYSQLPASIRTSALDQHEVDELDQFLMSAATSSETMMLDTLDGFLTAVVIGPEPIPAGQWMSRVWGPTPEHAPKFETLEQAQHINQLLIRHLNGIALQFMRDPAGFEPLFNVATFGEEHDSREYIDGQMWAWGFMQGVALNIPAWRPLIRDPESKALLHPFYLLGTENLPEEDRAQVDTPDKRETVARMIPALLEQIHAYWLPYRKRKHSPALVTPVSTQKTGRNDPCPCGSGKKYKKCCGNRVLH